MLLTTVVWPYKSDNIYCMNNYAYYLSINGDDLQKAEQMSYKTVQAEPKNATYLDTYVMDIVPAKQLY